MIAKLRYILGLQTAEEKLEEYTLLKGELSDINDRTDILAEDYVTKLNGFNDILKSESYGTEIKERVQKRYTHFLQEQKKEVIGLVNRRHKIEKSITSILKDEKIKDAVNEFELLEKAKSNYRDGNISKNVYNDIIKAKKGKVHYSDNFVFWNGKLLLIQRATDDDGANKWCLPGGHVDAGESHEKAAVRELVEETGIEAKNATLEGVYENDDVMIEYYTSNIESETEPSILLDSSEHQSYKWFDIYNESLDEMEFPFNMKENIEKILLPTKVEAKNISKAVSMFIDGYITKEVLSDIVKARTGYYSDNSENRRLKRVGQKYGTKGVKEEKGKDTKGEESIKEYAKQASDEALNTALKQSNDSKVKQVAKEEINERKEGGKEDTTEQPKENVSVGTEKKQEGKDSPISVKEKDKVQKKVEDSLETNENFKVDLLNKIKHIETGETRFDEDYDKDDAAYYQRRVMIPVYFNEWHYAENTDPQTEEFDSVNEALEDLRVAGDMSDISKYYTPLKQTRLMLKDVWISADNDIVDESDDLISYDDWAYDNDQNDFVKKFGKEVVVEDRSFDGRESSAEELEAEVYSKIHRDLPKRYKDFNLRYQSSGKYRRISVENSKGEDVGDIQLRIANHSYNPRNNDMYAKMGNFISIEIANKDETEGRFGGKYGIRFTGDDKYQDVVEATSERIKEIIDRWDVNERKIEKSQANQIKGGLADNLSVKDIADKHKVDVSKIKEQVTKGVKIEMEHTDDPKKAVEIALDHLVESPIYYDELEKMESKFHDKK